MRNIDLINYLSQFADDSELSMVVANPDKDVRNIYPLKDLFLLEPDEDRNFPCFMIGVGNAEPLKNE